MTRVGGDKVNDRLVVLKYADTQSLDLAFS